MGKNALCDYLDDLKLQPPSPLVFLSLSKDIIKKKVIIGKR